MDLLVHIDRPQLHEYKGSYTLWSCHSHTSVFANWRQISGQNQGPALGTHPALTQKPYIFVMISTGLKTWDTQYQEDKETDVANVIDHKRSLSQSSRLHPSFWVVEDIITVPMYYWVIPQYWKYSGYISRQEKHILPIAYKEYHPHSWLLQGFQPLKPLIPLETALKSLPKHTSKTFDSILWLYVISNMLTTISWNTFWKNL
jgi:hypothetical protein